MPLDPNFFRRESGRMVTAITRIFGIHNLALAEDVVQEAFCRALETWKFHGVPENPTAWLITVARNRALDSLRREKRGRGFAPEIGRMMEFEGIHAPTIDELLAPAAIQDDQLRMMFSCCHPRLPEEAQVMLILHILCGFSADEIARAFLSSRAAVDKRLVRAKRVFTTAEGLFDVMSAEKFAARMPSVHRALYLLFNEGYHGASAKFAVRSELCREAMHLTSGILRHPSGATPETHALAAVMCLGTARLPGRIGADGHLNAFLDQDRGRWDRGLIAEGLAMLEISATGANLSRYHVEAMIAATHVRAARAEDTDWRSIVEFYDTLMRIDPSPVVALNRAIAIGQRDGPDQGMREIEAIAGRDKLDLYPFHLAAMGEFELRLGHNAAAHDHFARAAALARNPLERRFLLRRAEVSKAVKGQTECKRHSRPSRTVC